jgi:N-sulfoglucosamine sulfohydrolase
MERVSPANRSCPDLPERREFMPFIVNSAGFRSVAGSGFLLGRLKAGLLLFTGALAGLRAGEVTRPNLVVIIADDLSWHDVACFGPTDAKTPHLDRLAREGLRLTEFHSPAAVCAPTRQALLTGLFPVRSGAYPNHSRVEDGTRSLPYYLKALGYRTACIGKTHFGPAESFPFDQFLGGAPTRGPQAGKSHAGDAEDADDHDLDGGQLERFIKAGGEPFFAYIAPHEPHSPWTKGDPSAYDPQQIKLPPYLVDTPETRRARAHYYAEVTVLDQEVGQMLQALEKTGHSRDTLVLFFSEQGSSLPHGKWTLYDPGIHVAAIARWPGQIKPGGVSPALIQYVDVAPTLIACAGGDPLTCDTGCPDATGNRHFDGLSFLDVLLGKRDTLRDMVFAQHTTRGIIKGSEAYGSRAVFDGRWKLIVNLEPELAFRNVEVGGAVFTSWLEKGRRGDVFAAEQAARYLRRPAVELYDHSNDPWELTNVAEQPANAAVIARLRLRLDAWMRQQGDRGDATERAANLHQGLAGKRKANHANP